MPHYINWAGSGAVGFFFVINGAVELPKWRGMVDDFVRWGYPSYWPLVTCLLKIFFGILIFVPSLQLVGLSGAGLIVIAGVATLVFHREKVAPKATVMSAVILAVAALAALTWTAP